MSNRGLDNLFKDIGRSPDVAWGHLGSYYSNSSEAIPVAGKSCLGINVTCVKGRKYKVSFVGSFEVHHIDTKTLIHGHIKLGGNWVDGAEFNSAWLGASFANNDKMDTKMTFGIKDWTADTGSTLLQIMINSNVADATLESGIICIEDIGPA